MHTKQQIAELGTILGIWAHPDDEIFTSSGLMLQAIQNGQKVIVITATRGDAGFEPGSGMTPEKMSEIREGERDEALRIVGVQKGYWLNYRDGFLRDVAIDEAVSKILNKVKNEAIDTIVTFEKNGITGHEDHKAVHNWSKIIAQKLHTSLICAIENKEFYDSYGRELDEKFNMYFNIDRPALTTKEQAAICIELDRETLNRKMSALKAHKSQTAAMLEDEDSINAVTAMCACECFIQA